MSKPSSPPRRVRIEPGIYQRPDGITLEIGFRDASGAQKWQKVTGGRKGSIKRAREALAAAHTKRASGVREAENPRLTFPQAADAWWDEHVTRLRPNTRNAYGAALKHLKKPEHFGRARMSDIIAKDVAKYVRNQQAAGLKGWTVKGHLTVISSVYTYAAQELGLVGGNPVALLNRVQRPSTDDEKAKRILNSDELDRLLQAVDDNYSTLFFLAAHTGGRLAEVLGLTWENIDLANETVTFSHQLDRNYKRVKLKTDRSHRPLEVTPHLIEKLREHKLASPYSGRHDLVFAGREGRGLDHRNIGGRVLARAVKAAGLQAVKDRHGEIVQPAPTFHALRHSHASALIAAGWDIEEVSRRLGHTSVATTMRVYTHSFDAAARTDDRRSRLAKLYPSMEARMEAVDGGKGHQTADPPGADVVNLEPKRKASQ